ncbi:histidine phosphatase family protein [Flavisphingomonas formosensis]|uniref:histidine phosphatase family protein n=1 Tax=Flavisphingomonas formosensis TaxID=861534 RepID=UPI0012F761C9|nr:histidine phosphatase family protein [Sphingomonas formosensis]
MSAPRLLHLMRHGAPMRTGLMLGHTDEPPNPAGIAACMAQAEGLDAATIIASDLARARQAGEAIAAECGMPLHVDPRWRELDFGAWDGRASAEIDRGALGRFWGDPDAAPPPGGERWSALRERVGAAIDGLPAGPALVVTHGGAMRAAMALLCGFALPQLWAFDLPYGALLSLRLWPGPQRSGQIVGLWP